MHKRSFKAVRPMDDNSTTRLILNIITFPARELGMPALPQSTAAVFVAICSKDGTTAVSIAEQIKQSPRTISGAIRELRKLGLVEVLESPQDRRTRILSLTKDGLKLHQKMLEDTKGLLNWLLIETGKVIE